MTQLVWSKGQAVAWALAIAMAGLSAANGALAQAERQATGGATRAGALAGEADIGFETARLSFERLPEAERIAVQDALVWSGDYTAAATGTFGRRTYEAIQAYQKRANLPVSGVLDPRARQGLLARGAEARARVGFALITDPVTGIRIGVPQKILTRRSENPGSGTRLQSADGKITLDLRATDGGEGALKSAYDRNLGIQSPGRNVSYHVLRPDFFVLSGETATGRFYLRYGAGADEVRGFSVGYDKSLAVQFDRIVIAMANSFEPFPARPGIAAAPSAASAGTAEPPPMPPRRPDGLGAVAATGIAIGPRLVLTSQIAETCSEPAIDGARARIVRQDRTRGLTLLETATDRGPSPVGLAPAGAALAAAEALVVFRSVGEGGRPVATPATLVGPGRLVAPLQEGASGGAVLGPDGSLIGLVGVLVREARAVAGLVPPSPYGYVDAAELRTFLGADAPPQRPMTGPARPGFAAAVAGVAPALVTVACGARQSMKARRRARPSIDFGDLGGTEPIGRAFGGDRGTPLDRHYIEDFLHRHEADVRGRVMEIGESSYTRRFGGERVTRSDVLDAPGARNPGATILADLQTGEGVPEAAFDCVVITQTLHMIYDLRGTLATLHRALKPGGVALATVPGITQIDAEDGPEKWFWSMTQSAARRLFAAWFGEDHVEVVQYGNVYAATAFLQGLALEEIEAEKLWLTDPLYPVITGIRAKKSRRTAKM